MNNKCPKCGKEMEHGYIHGNKVDLKWSKNEKEYTVFAGEQIGKKAGLLNGPSLEAWICNSCRIGIFNY